MWRENSDGEWQELPGEETAARVGVKYRNDSGTLYFDIRYK
jgi:hypothetical protein